MEASERKKKNLIQIFDYKIFSRNSIDVIKKKKCTFAQAYIKEKKRFIELESYTMVNKKHLV